MPVIPGVWLRCECGKIHILTVQFEAVCKCGRKISRETGDAYYRKTRKDSK